MNESPKHCWVEEARHKVNLFFHLWKGLEQAQLYDDPEKGNLKCSETNQDGGHMGDFCGVSEAMRCQLHWQNRLSKPLISDT